MKAFLNKNKIFLSLYFLFLLAGIFVIARHEKGDEIIYFNSLHTPFFDEFFKRVTQLAEFPLLIFILLVVVFMSYGEGFLLSLNILLVAAAVHILKHFVFSAQIRPSVFFEGKLSLQFVEGVKILHHNSFPSGHTAAAFALFFMLSVFLKNKKWSIALFSVALLVGVSRVYLFQHFFRDVYFGSLIGVTVSVLFYLSFGQSHFYNNLTWRNKALLK